MKGANQNTTETRKCPSELPEEPLKPAKRSSLILFFGAFLRKP